MQRLGYIIIDGIKYLILERSGTIGNYLKIRKSGPDGKRLNDEEDHLQGRRDLLYELRKGKTIYI